MSCNQKRSVHARNRVELQIKVSKTIAIIGAAIALAGAIVGLIVNANPYGDVKGNILTVESQIVGVNEQIDTEVQPSGSLSTTAYHLIAKYDCSGSEKSTVLHESYLKREFAEKHIGSTREITVDTADFSEIIKRDIDYSFVVLVGIGVVIAICGGLFTYYFSSQSSLF